MQELKKIGVMSAAKIAALFGFISGVIAIIASIALIAYVKTLPAEVQMQLGNVVYPGVAQVFIQIVLYTALFFVVWLILAALYNVFAGWIGGVKVDLSAVIEKKAKPKRKAKLNKKSSKK